MAKIKRSKVINTARVTRKHADDPLAPTRKLVYPDGFYGATLRGIRIAPQKARLVIDEIRGQPVDRAREILRYSHKRAGYYIDRVLLSALGNADVRSEGRVSAENLMVSECYVDEGTRLKRFLAGPMGRARPILRRMCHITVILGQTEEEEEEKEEAAEKE